MHQPQWPNEQAHSLESNRRSPSAANTPIGQQFFILGEQCVRAVALCASSLSMVIVGAESQHLSPLSYQLDRHRREDKGYQPSIIRVRRPWVARLGLLPAHLALHRPACCVLVISPRGTIVICLLLKAFLGSATHALPSYLRAWFRRRCAVAPEPLWRSRYGDCTARIRTANALALRCYGSRWLGC